MKKIFRKKAEEDTQDLQAQMKVKERNIPTLQTAHGEEIRQMEQVAEVEEEMIDHQITEVEEEMMDHQITEMEEETVDHQIVEVEEEMTDHQIPMVDPMMEIIIWMLEKAKENWH